METDHDYMGRVEPHRVDLRCSPPLCLSPSAHLERVERAGGEYVSIALFASVMTALRLPVSSCQVMPHRPRLLPASSLLCRNTLVHTRRP